MSAKLYNLRKIYISNCVVIINLAAHNDILTR